MKSEHELPDEIPEKQGLKLNIPNFAPSSMDSPRRNSRKTRIETLIQNDTQLMSYHSQTKFQKNKD